MVDCSSGGFPILRILIAPDSFKDCLTATQVAQAIEAGIRQVDPRIETILVPMADGGQGSVDAVLRSTEGKRQVVSVMGPLGTPVQGVIAILDDEKTALFEMASASGLELVPRADRNPMRTTTFGTGELLSAALDSGVERIIIGIGGSATNDGGAGVAQALGYALLDSEGNPIGLGGGNLHHLDRIDAANVHPRLKDVIIEVACDVTNPLTGPEGASHVYGPQKGATPEMVQRLDANLERLAKIVERDLGVKMDQPGAGAAGGLGGGLIAFAHAKLRRGIELIADAVHLRDRMQGMDLCITGEGAIDGQSAFGKTAVGVAQVAQELGIPVVAIAGSRGKDAHRVIERGITAYFDITPRPLSLEEALASAKENIAETAEQIVRLFTACRIK